MITTKLTNYAAFKRAGFPYVPRLDQSGRLLLPNFATCSDVQAIKHKRRLAITSGVVYNRCGLCAVYVCCVSNQGYRCRWMYFRGAYRVTWRDLSWDERRAVCRAYTRQRHDLPIFFAPTKFYKRWAEL